MFWVAAKDVLQLKLPKLHPVTWASDIFCEQLVPKEAAPITRYHCVFILASRNNWTHGDDLYNPASSVERVVDTLLSLELQERSNWVCPDENCVLLE